MSNHNKAQMMSALRFFDLIDKEGIPQPGLEAITHDKTGRKESIRGLIEKHYPDIVSLDFAKMTPSQLETALGGKRYSVQGETKKKAKTFLIKAAQHAGFTIHPLLTKITRKRRKGVERQATLNSGRGAQADTDGGAGTPDAVIQPPAKPRGTEKTVRLISGAGSVTLSIDVDLLELEPGPERDFVFGLRDMFRAYEKGSAGSAEATDKAEEEEAGE